MPVKISVLLLTLLAFSAPGYGNTDGWYQIELIVFANNSVTETDEVWPLQQRQYPEGVLSIGPTTFDELQPTTLAQLQDLEDYLALWGPDADVQRPATTDDFLFQSRRVPNYQTPVQPEISEPVTQTKGEQAGELLGLGPEEQSETLDYDALFETDAAVAFRNLPASEQLMGTIARSLRRSSLYRVLSHQSWLQPVGSEEEALPVMIQGGKRYDDAYELDGSITLSRARFLHLELDLWFTQFSPLYEGTNTSDRFSRSALDGSLAISPELRERYPEVANWLANRGQYTPIHSHQLTQSRRMRSSTMHFIDHPQFGVLIRTERYEPDPDA